MSWDSFQENFLFLNYFTDFVGDKKKDYPMSVADTSLFRKRIYEIVKKEILPSFMREERRAIEKGKEVAPFEGPSPVSDPYSEAWNVKYSVDEEIIPHSLLVEIPLLYGTEIRRVKFSDAGNFGTLQPLADEKVEGNEQTRNFSVIGTPQEFMGNVNQSIVPHTVKVFFYTDDEPYVQKSATDDGNGKLISEYFQESEVDYDSGKVYFRLKDGYNLAMNSTVTVKYIPLLPLVISSSISYDTGVVEICLRRKPREDMSSSFRYQTQAERFFKVFRRQDPEGIFDGILKLFASVFGEYYAVIENLPLLRSFEHAPQYYPDYTDKGKYPQYSDELAFPFLELLCREIGFELNYELPPLMRRFEALGYWRTLPFYGTRAGIFLKFAFLSPYNPEQGKVIDAIDFVAHFWDPTFCRKAFLEEGTTEWDIRMKTERTLGCFFLEPGGMLDRPSVIVVPLVSEGIFYGIDIPLTQVLYKIGRILSEESMPGVRCYIYPAFTMNESLKVDFAEMAESLGTGTGGALRETAFTHSLVRGVFCIRDEDEGGHILDTSTLGEPELGYRIGMWGYSVPNMETHPIVFADAGEIIRYDSTTECNMHYSSHDYVIFGAHQRTDLGNHEAGVNSNDNILFYGGH